MLSLSLFDGKCQFRSATPRLQANIRPRRHGNIKTVVAIERLPGFGLESSCANE